MAALFGLAWLAQAAAVNAAEPAAGPPPPGPPPVPGAIPVFVPTPGAAPTAAAPAAQPEGSKAVAGYGWSNKPRKGTGKSVHHAPKNPHAAVAVLPGFAMREDGGSRFFVQLSRQAEVVEQKAPGSITYVLKGVRIDHRNNQNSLVTVHFSTPVTVATLVPAKGGDAQFVLALRAAVTPTWQVVAGAAGASVLQIDFPKGDYLAVQPAPSERAATDAAASAKPAKKGAARGPKKPAKVPH